MVWAVLISDRHRFVSVFGFESLIKPLAFLLSRVMQLGRDVCSDDIRSHFFKFLGSWIHRCIYVEDIQGQIIGYVHYAPFNQGISTREILGSDSLHACIHPQFVCCFR